MPPLTLPANPVVASVVVATRNRGASVTATLDSILGCRRPDFEVLLVDQGTDDATRQAIASYRQDPRFNYLPSETVGAGRARNVAFSSACGEYLLITDDDCIVPPNWIEGIVAVFEAQPRVGVVYCSVAPGEHNQAVGTIPNHLYRQNRILRTVTAYARSIGMGAGMAIRRSLLDDVGVFDEQLGPGARLLSGEDHDYAIRALIHRWWVAEVANLQVIHEGFRTFEQFRQLTQRDWVALGAVHAKILKCGHGEVWSLVLYNLGVRGFGQPMALLLRGRRPQGFRRLWHYGQGFRLGWQSPVDRARLLFR